ncbi:hypothetical protein FA13DRAFT_1802299 [Coprinellus micaceus]|uniref:Uncharacterized protein n=1 Tax=Coprinellus micaceus TaxID=71717 RepID=A0A4Y7SCI0_COPMI|nr:hypothetical protein FA13DRAFT_1802299 [Coprinellus micaceus]
MCTFASDDTDLHFAPLFPVEPAYMDMNTVQTRQFSRLIHDAKFHAKASTYRRSPSSGHKLTATQNMRVPTVECMFFGNGCDSAFVVPVPVVCASIDEGRYFDVAFRFWVNASNNRTQTSFSVDRYMIHVPQYPVNSTVPAEYQYTIFVSRSPTDPDNDLIKSLHGGKDIRVGGSVLVVRSTRDGYVRPVFEDDRYFIETMLVEILTTRLRSNCGGPADKQMAL